MTLSQINKLCTPGAIRGERFPAQLLATHISWVLLCSQDVYKIKKPVQYSFLDFSTLEKRKFYCERELELNRRLTHDMYLDVVPIHELSEGVFIGQGSGLIIDYAVRMKKMDRNRQMDVLLAENRVTGSDIQLLAEKMALFHKSTPAIYNKKVLEIREEFNDLNKVQDLLTPAQKEIIEQAIKISDIFVEKHTPLFYERLHGGYYRDCHGDLHSGNIFLLTEPEPFDCIEFNDEYRHIDVLNEVAFLCMDLEAFGRKELANQFLHHYNKIFPAIRGPEDESLLLYYKLYRANIRTKVNILRSQSAPSEKERRMWSNEIDKYLGLMTTYLDLY